MTSWCGEMSIHVHAVWKIGYNDYNRRTITIKYYAPKMYTKANCQSIYKYTFIFKYLNIIH